MLWRDDDPSFPRHLPWSVKDWELERQAMRLMGGSDKWTNTPLYYAGKDYPEWMRWRHLDQTQLVWGRNLIDDRPLIQTVSLPTQQSVMTAKFGGAGRTMFKSVPAVSIWRGIPYAVNYQTTSHAVDALLFGSETFAIPHAPLPRGPFVQSWTNSAIGSELGRALMPPSLGGMNCA